MLIYLGGIMKNKLNIDFEFQGKDEKYEKDIVLAARKYILDLIFNKYSYLMKAS